MRFLRLRFTMRRLMVIFAFAGLALTAINLANDPSFPIKNPESTSVHFAVRDSPIDHDYSGLIVIDQTIGRVWYGSWSLRQ
jgi:hypothetical protein